MQFKQKEFICRNCTCDFHNCFEIVNFEVRLVIKQQFIIGLSLNSMSATALTFFRLAFPLWLLTNILFFVLLRYGAYFLIMTGLSMITADIIWATLRNFNDLKIPWEEGIMEFSYGGSFYISLITGCEWYLSMIHVT